MKYILALLVIVIALPSVAQASVRINEIAWMGISGANGANGEWIEFYNSSNTVDVTGWNLFKKQNDTETKIASLSGVIESGGFFVVERSTATLPDPLPQIDDGKLLSALVNHPKGEWLILRDSVGVVVDELNFQSGWTAGDNVSKNTMQFTGSSWITAKPTPKYANAKEGVITPKSVTGGAATAQKKPTQTVSEPEIALSIQKNVYQNIRTVYTASALIPQQYKNGMFVWNMGDGTSIDYRKIVSVSHIYEQPGTYVIALGYVHKGETVTVASETVHVVPLHFLLELTDSHITISHAENFSVDISGWRIAINGKTYTFPSFSTLAQKGVISIALSRFGLQNTEPTAASLSTPEGFVVTSLQTKKEDVVRYASGISSTSTAKEKTSEILTHTEKGDIFVRSEMVEAQQNRTNYILIGAVIVVGIALFILLERFTVQKE